MSVLREVNVGGGVAIKEGVSVSSAQVAAAKRSGVSMFLCYAHEDAEIARRLREELESGWDARVWIDYMELRVGDSIVDKISQAIRDCDYLVAAVSPASMESGWCRSELEQGLAKGCDEKRKVVLPLLLNVKQPPPSLSDIYAIPLDPVRIDRTAAALLADMRRDRAPRTDQAS